MKTNTMNRSNSNYFWKIIFTNKCSVVKVQRKCSIKEHVYVLPLPDIKFLVQYPCDILLTYISSLKNHNENSHLMCAIFWTVSNGALEFDGFDNFFSFGLQNTQASDTGEGKVRRCGEKMLKNYLSVVWLKALCFRDVSRKLWQASVRSWSLSC